MRNWFLLGVITLTMVGITRLISWDNSSTVRVNVNPAAIYWDGQEINASTLSADRQKDGKSLPATLEYQGTLYVPLSLIGEQLDKQVGWDQKSSTAWVGKAPEASSPTMVADASAIKPAVTQAAPPAKAEPSQPVSAPKKTGAVVEPAYELFGLKLGMSAKEVTDLLGEPDRMEPSSLGYQWWIYNKDYASYLQVGVVDDKVVDLYSNAPLAKLGGTGIGASLKSIENKHPLQNIVTFSYMGAKVQITNQKHQRPLVMKDSKPVIYYLDQQNSSKVTAVRMMDTKMLLRGGFYETKWTYTGQAPNFDPPALTVKQRELVNAAYERQILDLVNVTRYRYKLPPLQWHGEAAEVARKHSQDMANHDFFDHVSATTGLDPFARLKQANIRYTMAGENIAAGYPDAIEAHESWMNSPGHRKNVLEKGFSQLGVGVITDYYTQAFLTISK
ncbi:CAP-associated domain-containing protein [Brevibacillus sp. AY1]|uniref:CAP-associated domain-containing protein n=1 Tax=Brevibacillus sp. AY1 TaxID=2807621 RepID=UPI00245721F9|nr:CAP-associated domain-containing protein [Brevibacillus sp. AY1]MDH4619692.1 secretion protein [Brevibacillus sp. AY1]